MTRVHKDALIALALAAMFVVGVRHLARAQDYQGRHGHGHDRWHGEFYSKLKRNDTKTSCCDLSDCVPTQSRMVGARHQVMVDGEWTDVPPEVIQKVTAPDGGAHVCFPKPSPLYPKGTLFCVVLPPET